MEKIGRVLKYQRQSLGISLREAEEGTKINLRYLHAIEEGNFQVIPGGRFYLKGFLKNYGNYLGLDGSALVEYYEQLLQEQSVTYEEKKALRYSSLPKKKGGFLQSLYHTLISFMQL
ncbi:MAG: helix-turn-helix domain-containing protein [Thermoanaerobacteraceae bacterium]|nr:helix-turn-helix domain-containing protein [Thermoanaerobacteraceae bacterium]